MQYELILTGKFKKSLKLAGREALIYLFLRILSLCFRTIFLWKKSIETMN